MPDDVTEKKVGFLPTGFSVERLKDGQESDIRTALNLSETEDGLFTGQDATLILFPVGAFLPWQKADMAITWHWLAGAPLAFSYSADGHDAAALHLGPRTELHQHESHDLPAGVWHTAESLGNWSLLACNTPNRTIERAAPDWFPTPRRSAFP